MKIAFNPSTVAALTSPPDNKDITFDLRGQNIFARGVKFLGTDTNTWRDIKINNVSIGSHTLDLRNGSNTTLTNTNGVVIINSTWRPVVDNLTSNSTTSSLSANLGRVLKALIDGKSDSDHNHDDRYLRLTGGWMSGDINFGGDNRIYWGRNTDSASISFKNDGDGDTDSYMSFVTSDNGNEYFRWSHSSGSANTEWMALRSDGLRVGGTKVSLEGHSHNDLYYTKTEVNNKLNGKSDTSHTHDDRYLKLTGGTMSGTIYRNSGGTTISGRDHAIIRLTYAPGGSSWNPIACVDTETGTWTLGHLSSGDSDTNFHFCFSTNTDYNAGNNNGNYVTLRNKEGTIALLSEIPDKNSWNYDDRYYTKAESNAKYITDITTSVNKLTFTRNEANIAKDITVNVVYSLGLLPNISDESATTKASPGLLIYDSYNLTIGTNLYSSVLSINTGGTIQIAGNWGDDLFRNLYWRSLSDRAVSSYPWKSWRTILDSENYSSTLDSRYYTESEVNSLLDAKLNRQNLSYGIWNPRGYNLAADYCYNGGDLSISENGGLIHVSIDGYFWLNEGQYRVLDTSDVASLKGDLTVHLYLSDTDTTWHPLIWGGSSHNNTSDSTGEVYKSYDKLSWLTSSLTLHATNLYTGRLETVNNHYYRFNSDATLRIYGPSSGNKERIYFLAGIDNRIDDYDIPSYGGELRHSIILNPRGGFVGIGNTNPSYKLSVGGDIGTEGNIYISHSTNNNMNYNTSNPRIVFSKSGMLAVGLVYTNYDSYRPTKGLKVMDVDNDDTGNVWFEVLGYNYSSGYVKNGSNYNYVLLGDGGHKLESSLSVSYATTAGSATKASYVTLTYCKDDSSPVNKGLWNTIKNGTSSAQTNKVNFYTIYNSAGGPSGHGEMMEILSYNANHWQPQLWFGAGKTGGIYYRNKSYNDNTWGSWQTVAFTSQLKDPVNYYWANIKVSASSSSGTSPTFSTAYTSNWFRSTGSTGWYSLTYGGGINMVDSTWIRTYGGKSFYCDNLIYSSNSIRMGNIYLLNSNEINNGANDGLHLNYRNTGNVTMCVGGGKVGIGTGSPTQRLDVNGNIRATGQIVREGSSLFWVNGRNGALLRETSVAGYHTLWSLKTTNGSWDFGEYSAGSSLNNVPVLSYVTDSDYNSGNNITTYQIRFPLDSGTVALTKNIPTSLPANGGSADNARALRYTGTGYSEITAFQTDASYMGRSGWASYIICNHGDGNTYYSLTIAFPFWSSPIYRRLENGIDKGWKKFYTEENPPSWNNVTNKPSSFTPSSHTHTWTSITDKIVADNEFNIVNAGFKESMWFNYLPINDRSKTATIPGYHFGNGAKGYASIVASGFIKSGGNASQLLRADGGVSTFNWSGLSGLPTWLWGGNSQHSYYVYNPSNFRVAYASSAGSVAWSNVSGRPSSLKNPYSLNVFGVAYDGSAAKTVTTSTFIGLVSEATSTITDGTMFITSWASDSGFADTNAVNVPYKRKVVHLWEYIKAKTDTLYSSESHTHPYLPLAGGTMNANARISHGNGNLYIGRADNNGWVYTQDIASHAGTDKWNIKTSGAAKFGIIHIASKSDGSFNSNVIECGSSMHLNYFSSLNVSLCNGGGKVGIGTISPYYKLDVNGLMRADGFHHGSVNSNNYMLLAGGGYKSFGGDDSNPIFLGYLNLDHGNDGTISSSFSCLGYSVPFTYTRGGNYCRITIPDTTYQVFYIKAATASVNYSGGGMDTWVGSHRGSGAWWLHCYASGDNEVKVKGFRQSDSNNDSWWGGNPLWSNNDGANKITVCIFGYVQFK